MNHLVWLHRRYTYLTSPISFLVRNFIKIVGIQLNIFDENNICLDIGAGTAPYKAYIKKQWGDCEYISLDIAANDTTDVVGSATQLPFKSGSIGTVISFDVLQHIPDYLTTIYEIHRVLTPQGRFLISFPFNYSECDFADFRRWTLEGMSFDLRENGFEIVIAKQRGGRFFCFACSLNWVFQHLIPGQRSGWRSKKTVKTAFFSTILIFITIPTMALQWIMLAIDLIFPNKGCYMGGLILAKKKTP